MNTKFDDAIDEELRNRLYKSVHEEFVIASKMLV